MQQRRGFSLLEILIAVSLLLALAALSMPVLLPRLAERTFETAVEVFEQQLLLARATAQSTGHPVEVRYRAPAEDSFDPGRIEVRWFDDGTAVDPDAEGARVPGELVSEGWAVRLLPRGVVLSRNRPPESFATEDEFGPEFDAFEPDPPEEAPLRRLAVFLPDGSVLMSVPAWIRDDGGRAGVIELDGWLGTARFTRLADVPDEDAEAPAALDEGDEDVERPGRGEPTERDRAEGAP